MALLGLSKQRQRRAIGLLSTGSFLLVWEAIGRLNFIDPLFTSYPSLIVQAGIQVFATGEIYKHLALSGQEFGIGFAIAAVLGVFMGLAMGRIAWFNHVSSPFVNAIYATPVIIFLPLFVFWFGIGIWTKIVLIIAGAYFPVLINTYEGVRSVDPVMIEAAKSYGAKERDVFFKVVLIAVIPFIIGGLRLGVGRALISMLVAELFIATGGIGYLLASAGMTYQTSRVFVFALFVAFAGAISSELILRYERRIAPWLYVRQVE